MPGEWSLHQCLHLVRQWCRPGTQVAAADELLISSAALRQLHACVHMLHVPLCTTYVACCLCVINTLPWQVVARPHAGTFNTWLQSTYMLHACFWLT